LLFRDAFLPKVKEAPDPSVIKWENIKITKNEINARRIEFGFLTYAVLIAGFFALIWTTGRETMMKD
jgi:hypothetical protein